MEMARKGPILTVWHLDRSERESEIRPKRCRLGLLWAHCSSAFKAPRKALNTIPMNGVALFAQAQNVAELIVQLVARMQFSRRDSS